MCTQYSLHSHVVDVLQYVTDAGIPPIVFGLGLAGNLLVVLVLTRSKIRSESAVYVYLAATSVVDLFALLCAVPTFVRDLELLPVPVSHSYPAALGVWIRGAVEPIVRHSAMWFVAMAVVVRVAVVRRRRSAETKVVGSELDDDPPARCTRISSAFIVTLVVIVVCVLLDITRFFESAVVPLVDHCFDPSLVLWSVNRTRLASIQPGYFKIQSAVVGAAIPLTIAALFAIVLLISTSACCRQRARNDDDVTHWSTSVFLRTPPDHDAREHQLTVTIIAVAVATICLDGSRAAIEVAEASFGFGQVSGGTDGSLVVDHYEMVRIMVLVANCLSLVRCSVNFFLIASFNYDFRKILRRTLCCCCPAPDDVYYEPVVCCSRRRSSETFDETICTSKQYEIIRQAATTRNEFEIHTRNEFKTHTRNELGTQTRNELGGNAVVSLERQNSRKEAGVPSRLPQGTVRTSSDGTQFGATEIGSYCDVDDHRAIWI